jgi:hypothetical protein
MSIDVYGFLGTDTKDLELRVVQSFTQLGFSVAIHPEPPTPAFHRMAI